ncbi:JAB N-terminal domain-containing protein [Streptomyces sp. NPDC004069]
MTLEVELYRDGADEASRRLPLPKLLKAVLATELENCLAEPVFMLTFENVPGTGPYAGPPRLTYRDQRFGHVNVVVQVEGNVVYRQRHSVNGLLGPVLAEVARATDPGQDAWTFRIDSPAFEDSPGLRMPPEVRGTIDVDVARSSRLSFGVRPAREPDVPDFDAKTVGVPAELGHHPVSVLLSPDVKRLLERDLPLSGQVEEGGFLFGKVYRRPDAPEHHVVMVEHVLPAEHSGASLMHFTFTGDSFRTMRRVHTEQHPEDQLVGWYHTHLFAPSGPFGLSETDVALHRATFRRPWQIAGLINIHDNRRILRCYVGTETSMRSCPLWSRDDDSEQYRRTPSALGHQ